MTTATFEGAVLAKSDSTVVVEGNHYFPQESVNWDYLAKTDHATGCPWKGTASYFTVTVGDTSKENLAWTYESPKDAAAEIKDHVAFYPAVQVS